MKNVFFLLVSLLLMAFLTSCTAEELPATEETLQMEVVNMNNLTEGETNPLKTSDCLKIKY